MRENYWSNIVRLLGYLPERLLGLIKKLLGVHGLVFGMGTYLMVTGRIAWWGWMLCAGIVLGYRYFKAMLDKGTGA